MVYLGRPSSRKTPTKVIFSHQVYPFGHFFQSVCGLFLCVIARWRRVRAPSACPFFSLLFFLFSFPLVYYFLFLFLFVPILASRGRVVGRAPSRHKRRRARKMRPPNVVVVVVVERGWRRQGANKKKGHAWSRLWSCRASSAPNKHGLSCLQTMTIIIVEGKKRTFGLRKKKREKEDHDDWRITALPNTVDPSGQCGAAAFVPPFFSWGAAPLGDRHRTTDTKTWADTCRSIRAL